MPGEAKSRRLGRLLAVQRQLKSFHETRRAGMLKAAADAGREAEETAARKEGAASLSTLFPEIYERAITRALERRDKAAAEAEAEAGRIATETARLRMLEKALRAARADEARAETERDGLESVERMIARGRGPAVRRGS